MSKGFVRPIAVCIFRNGNRILVGEGRDCVKEETFYRPLGGTIEFGEHSREAIVREIREELGAEIAQVRFLGALENIFTYEGNLGHEIVLVYEADFADESMYEKPVVNGVEEGNWFFPAVWKSLSDFEDGSALLYPDGLLELLKKHWHL